MPKSTLIRIIIATIFTICTLTASSKQTRIINFKFPNLYPESLTWDPLSRHFIVSSLRHPILHSISEASVLNILIYDPSLPPSTSLYGIRLDPHRRRLLAALHSTSSPPFSALASYDLRTGRRIFLSPLPDPNSSRSSSSGADDLAVDFSGNAYVTNAASNIIYKVSLDGQPSILSRSPVFTQYSVNSTTPYSSWGLNGVVYIDKGYLLSVQSNTGKMFKVNVDDGATTTVLLNEDLKDADGMAVRRDGIVVVVSPHKVYFIKSDSNWREGVVYDEIALDAERFATSVTTGDKDRIYVLYGHVGEGMMGTSFRDDFSIVQMESERDTKEGPVWVFILIGLGLAYFLFWRFQMGQLATKMNRKIA